MMSESTGFIAFKGQGNRSSDTQLSKPVYVRGIPDYEYNIGSLKFLRNMKPVDNKEVINRI